MNSRWCSLLHSRWCNLLLLISVLLQFPSPSASSLPSSHPPLFSTQSLQAWSEKHPPWRLFQQHQQQEDRHHTDIRRFRSVQEFPDRLANITLPTAENPSAPASFFNSTGNNASQYSCKDANGCCPPTCFSTSKYGDWVHELVRRGKGSPWLRVCGLAGWLLILFYLLGTTASDYFSCTLEKLSDELKLSPAVAGVSLLAIGNGAPDVFSSVAAFVSSDKSGGIGFSCVLGGALFITTVVSGTVALVTAKSCKAGSVRIDFGSFLRDAVFLLASAGTLCIILLDGKVQLWEAIAFLCIYVIYAIFVAAGELIQKHYKQDMSLLDPLLMKTQTEASLPQWGSFSSEPHHLYHIHVEELDTEVQLLMEDSGKCSSFSTKLKHFLLVIYQHGIARPFAIPRRLTIPVIEKERWSRPLAVASCSIAPVFVGAVWIIHCSDSTMSTLLALVMSGVLGLISGLFALFNTENDRPPQRYLWLWLGAGFVMSIVWFYLIADELVATLEALGVFFSINPAILGLTVLAWGNSVGDLVADLALACSGREGVQIAVSGCYAGPLFNMVVGLGVSLIVACWKSGPEPFLIADDNGSLFYIIGFLAAGIIWALTMMQLKGMMLSRSMGLGLLFLYGSFLATGVCYTMGWISQ